MPRIKFCPMWIVIITLCLSAYGFAQETPRPAPTPAPIKAMTTAEELAVALVAAKTEDERNALLSAHKELQTVELRKALMEQGNWFGEQVEQVVDSPRGAWRYLPRDYQRALTSYSLAQAIAEQMNDQTGIADALQGIGEAHYGQDKQDLALEAHRKALTLYEALGDKRGIAHALYGISNVNQSLGKDDLVMEYCQKVVALRDALGSRAADQFILAGALGDIGGIYFVQGKYDLALEYYEKSLALFDAAGNKRYTGIMLWLTGSAHNALGHFDVAYEYHIKGLRLLEASGNEMHIPYELQDIGRLELLRGNFGLALEYHQKALAMFEARGDKSRLPNALVTVGIVHYMQGSYDLAMEYYQKALRQAMQNKEAAENKQAAWWDRDIASVLERIGRTYAMLGNYDLALENSHKALAFYKAAGSKSFKNINAFISTDIAYVHLKRGDYDLAMQYYQQALTDAAQNDWTKTRALNGMGEIYLRRGNYEQALELASRSAAVFKQGVFRGNALYGLLDSRTVAGRAYQRLNQPNEARQAFDEAIALVEGLRTQIVGGEQERQRFFEGGVSPYHAMVELLIDQNTPSEALAYAERAKARALLDVLQSGRVNITKTMTPQEREEERKLVSEMVSLNTQISQERMRPQPDQSRLDDLNARLKKARLEYETFQVKLYVAHPELKVQRGEVQPLKLEEAAALLPDTKSALLEYVVTDERTYLFVLTKNEQEKVGLKTYTLAVKRKDLAARTEAFRRKLARRDLGFKESARELYEMLLGPARDQLRGKSTVIIVPDDVLWELPFQALQPAGNRHLIEEYAISYAPSLTVLREMMKLRRSQIKNTTPSLLAVGNPTLRKETIARVQSIHRDERLDPLPETEKEATTLAQLYGPTRSKVYVGAEAREDRLKTEAGQFKVLHLATHGILNNASPMYSQLVLAQATGTDREDGLLEAWEIMNLDLKADLVVLSACETARGRVGPGEGMVGLTWALFVAGSPTSVVSQWKVSSASTSQLMLEFHRNLRGGNRDGQSQQSTAGALRAAALKLLRDKETQHPFYWAGFIVVGDGR